MMSETLKQSVIVLLFVFLGSAATAQQDAVEEEVVRRYTVELVVFAYAEDISSGSEVFVRDEPVIAEDALPADESENESTDNKNARQSAKKRPAIRRLEFSRLPRNEYTMTDIRRRLELLDAYDPIMHVAWTQPTYPQEETAAIRLSALGRVPAKLDGTFTLYLSRYLHLVVDLQLDASDANSRESNQSYGVGDSQSQDGTYLDPNARATRYRIRENRILKNGELRYFDHPKFGVIAKATRVEENEEEQESKGETRTDAPVAANDN